jgi:hypothetical protein
MVAETFIPYIARCFDLLYQSGKQLVDISQPLAILETLFEKPVSTSTLPQALKEDSANHSASNGLTNELSGTQNPVPTLHHQNGNGLEISSTPAETALNT